MARTPSHGEGYVIYAPSLGKYFTDPNEYEWLNLEYSFRHSDVAEASFYKMKTTVLEKIGSLSWKNPDVMFVIRPATRSVALVEGHDDIDELTAFQELFQDQIDELQKEVDRVNAMSEEQVDALSKSSWEAFRTKKRTLKKLLEQQEHIKERAA